MTTNNYCFLYTYIFLPFWGSKST